MEILKSVHVHHVDKPFVEVGLACARFLAVVAKNISPSSHELVGPERWLSLPPAAAETCISNQSLQPGLTTLRIPASLTHVVRLMRLFWHVSAAYVQMGALEYRMPILTLPPSARSSVTTSTLITSSVLQVR
jgi:hypothetical protein